MTMTTSEILTKSKRRWAENRDVVLRGTPLNYNFSDEMDYRQALLKITKSMIDEVVRRVTSLFETKTAQEFFVTDAKSDDIAEKAQELLDLLSKKYYALFGRKSDDLAENMLNNSKKSSKSALHASLKDLSGGLSLKTGVIPEGMEIVSKAIVNENVALIKSIPEKYLTDVSGAVMRSISTGKGLKTLIPELKQYSTQNDKRVKLLALDQTRKAYNTINAERMKDLGVKKFEWMHSNAGQKPRKSHQAMNGKIYSFDNLPIINKEQVARGHAAVRGIPGQAINCRCKMKPVIVFDK